MNYSLEGMTLVIGITRTEPTRFINSSHQIYATFGHIVTVEHSGILWWRGTSSGYVGCNGLSTWQGLNLFLRSLPSKQSQ